ncbi:unnamed protein product [Linum trigynum]|uniref:Uncharacterized protein n=1 Tax=Linum trigynum TaxID=586398 RepID=A0AAV2ERZ4_9ROSI
MTIDSQTNTPSDSQNRDLSGDIPAATTSDEVRTSDNGASVSHSSSKTGGASGGPSVGVKLAAQGMIDLSSPLAISDIEWDLENVNLVSGYENTGELRVILDHLDFSILGLNGNAFEDTGVSLALRCATSAVGDNLCDFRFSQLESEFDRGPHVVTLSSDSTSRVRSGSEDSGNGAANSPSLTISGGSSVAPFQAVADDMYRVRLHEDMW